MNLKKLLEVANCNVMIMRESDIVLCLTASFISESICLLSDSLLYSDIKLIEVNPSNASINVWLVEDCD